MGMTKTVHPPAGATALMAVTSNEVLEMGWFLVPLIGLGSVLMVGVACVVNNFQRTWPVYWWTPEDLSRKEELDGGGDVEKGAEREEMNEIEQSGRVLILIDGRSISIPDWMSLDVEDYEMLEVLRSKLEKGLDTMSSRGSQATFVVDSGGSKAKS